MKDSRLKQFLLSMYWKEKEMGTVLKDTIDIVLIRLRYPFHILSTHRTINCIIKNKYSIARFGDGEFGLIRGTDEVSFQNNNKDLGKKLEKVLLSEKEKLLVCLPRTLISTRHYNKRAKSYWHYWSNKNHNQKWLYELLSAPPKKKFGNSLISRPYLDFEDENFGKTNFREIKKMWKGRNLLIVEGAFTCLGVGNDLFVDALNIRRIIAPPRNAIEVYDKIVDAIKEFYNKDDLILLALGPTATILAYELVDYNMQAIDIGHIDIEYEWYLRKASSKIPIPGKFVGEAVNGDVVELCEDLEYLSQVICRIH